MKLEVGSWKLGKMKKFQIIAYLAFNKRCNSSFEGE